MLAVKQCNGCARTLPADQAHFYRRKEGWLTMPCKACTIKRTAERYAARSEEINAMLRQKLALDPERRKRKAESDGASYQKHREARLQQYKEYRARPDVAARIAAYFKDRLASDQDLAAQKRLYLKRYHAQTMADPMAVEKLRARSRAFARANPEKVKAATRNRRAMLRSAPGKHTAQDVAQKLAVQAYKCYWCQCDISGGCHTVDHVIPLAKGGANSPDNLVAACAYCNCAKQDKLPEEFLRYLKQNPERFGAHN